MSDIALQVDNLSKQYRIGRSQDGRSTYGSLRETLAEAASAPLRRLRRSSNGDSKSETDFIWALKDVSFEVKKGEVVGIIGRNGAGKTTLLKVLSRITRPTHGNVRLWGRVGSLLEVGTGFHPELTGRENIYLNGAVLGMGRVEIERKFDEIVDFAEIEQFLDTPVKRYSSGMYMRLAFAVAAHLEPEILLVDEVLAVGDAAFQKKCLRKMGKVAQEGRTVLFVSHNMAAIKELCQRGILLSHGQVSLSTNTEEVVRTYLRNDSKWTSERTWSDLKSAPGDDIARICAVRIMGQDGAIAQTIDTSSPFYVEIEYYVLIPGISLNVSISIFNSEEIYVLASPSSTDSEWYGNPHPIGLFKSRCLIPGFLLNHGRHSISALLVNTDRARIITQLDRIVSVDINDLGIDRKGYYGYWGGVVRPLLNWKTVHLADENSEDTIIP